MQQPIEEIKVNYIVKKNRKGEIKKEGTTQPNPSRPGLRTNNNIPFLHAYNESIYGSQPDEQNAGKWRLHIPTNKIDGAWNLIKQGIDNGDLWNCKVSTVNNDFPDHILDVSSIDCKDIADISKNYNYLVRIGLIGPNDNILFKSDAQTRDPKLGNHLYESNHLPYLLMDHLDLKVLQSGLDENSEFQKSLVQLAEKLSDNIRNQIDQGLPVSQIMQSEAVKCAIETLDMLKVVVNPDIHSNDKMKAIATFEEHCCTKSTALENFGKAAAFVAITALGFLLGAGIGVVAGLIAGSWSGPGAAASSILGLFKGAVEGAAIGVTIASAVTGITAGTVSAYLFFKPEPAQNVANEAKKRVKEEKDLIENNENSEDSKLSKN